MIKSLLASVATNARSVWIRSGVCPEAAWAANFCGSKFVLSMLIVTPLNWPAA